MPGPFARDALSPIIVPWKLCAVTCDTQPPPDVKICPSCGSPHIARHKELHGLTIAHLDCDAFYATIEKRDRPELRDVPVIVGGHHRGVVAGVLLHCPSPWRALGHADVQGLESLPQRRGHQA